MKSSQPYGGFPFNPGPGQAQLTPSERTAIKNLAVAKGHHHQNLKYYPSLSGSETDVSTSTENLTQVKIDLCLHGLIYVEFQGSTAQVG